MMLFRKQASNSNTEFKRKVGFVFILIFINGLSKNVPSDRELMYADDTTVINFCNNLQEIHVKRGITINQAKNWM